MQNYLIKSIKWSIIASDIFLLLRHLNVLTKWKCPIKWPGNEVADSGQQAQQPDCTWKGHSWSSAHFTPSLFTESSEELSPGRGRRTPCCSKEGGDSRCQALGWRGHFAVQLTLPIALWGGHPHDVYLLAKMKKFLRSQRWDVKYGGWGDDEVYLISKSHTHSLWSYPRSHSRLSD